MSKQHVLALTHSDQDVAGTLPSLFAERGVDLEVRSINRPLIQPEKLDRLIVMGSPESAYDTRLAWLSGELAWLKEVQRRGVPTLGICFGGQILSRALGGQVARCHVPEVGWTLLDTGESGWSHKGPWLNFHFDAFTLPPHAQLLGRTEIALQAFRLKKAIGVQFHPEIDIAMFDTWMSFWETTEGGRQFMSTAGDLPDRMRREIQLRELDARSNCRRLIGDFLEI